MDEFERIVDQTGSSLERELISEGRAYAGPAELRAHTLAALGLAGSAGLASGSLLAWFAHKSLVAKLFLLLPTITLLVGGVVGYLTIGKAPHPRDVRAPAVPPTPPSTEAVASPVELPGPSRGPAPAVATPSRARNAAPPPGSALRAELAALDAIRSTLANNDPAGALSFLDAYFRTFPQGRLTLEAEVLRIDALAQSGRLVLAKRSAQEFLRHHPNSVLNARVQPYAHR